MNKFSKFQAEVICELHPLFKGLMWVASARSTDETRLVINSVKVERDELVCKIIATDGRRLHVHTFDPGMFDDDIQMIEPGLYEVITKTSKLIVIAESECGQKYPDWRKVIPEYGTSKSLNVNSRTLAKIGIRSGVLLANDFASDAVGFGHGRKKDEEVLVRYGFVGVADAVVIEHDLGMAVVMPLRQGDEEESSDSKSDADCTPNIPGLDQDEASPPPLP